MNNSLSTKPEPGILTVQLQFEKVHALLMDTYIYLFKPDGGLVDCQKAVKGRARLDTGGFDWQTGYIVVSPLLEELTADTLCLESVRQYRVFETALLPDTAAGGYVLPPVPEETWRWWLVHSLWKKVRQNAKPHSKFAIW